MSLWGYDRAPVAGVEYCWNDGPAHVLAFLLDPAEMNLVYEELRKYVSINNQRVDYLSSSLRYLIDYSKLKYEKSE